MPAIVWIDGREVGGARDAAIGDAEGNDHGIEVNATVLIYAPDLAVESAIGLKVRKSGGEIDQLVVERPDGRKISATGVAVREINSSAGLITLRAARAGYAP